MTADIHAIDRGCPTGKGCAGKQRSTGFTLVECVVVLAILGAVTLAGVATLSPYIPSARLAHAARSIVSLCRHARTEAIRSNRMIRLDCQSTANTCSLHDGESSESFKTVNFTEIGGVTLARSFTTSFNGRGRASRAGTVSVAIEGGETRSVVVRTSGSVVTR